MMKYVYIIQFCPDVQTCSKYIENEKKWKVKRLVEAFHILTSSEAKQKKICDKNLGNVRKKIFV